MVVKSFKLTKKTAVVAIVTAAILLAAVVLAFSVPAEDDVSTREGRVAYLETLGWAVDPDTEAREVIVLPREFTGVIGEYNEMQKKQGFDLSEYAGLECVKFTYTVTNYPNGDDTVLAQLFIFGTRVIGGDVHSSKLQGFMHGLK